MQQAAWLCAALSLLWSTCAAAALWRDRRRSGSVMSGARFVPVAHAAALFFAVVVVVVQSVVVVMRLTFVTVDLIHGYPWSGYREYGFGPDGLWSLGVLFSSCAVSLVSTRDSRLVTCQMWLWVMLVVWASMLVPALTRASAGGYERTGTTMLLLACLSGVVFTTAVVLRGATALRRRLWSAPVHPVPSFPGLGMSVGVLSVAVALLVCYHLLVPVKLPWGGIYGPGLVATGSAALAAWGSVLLAGTTRGGASHELAIGLGSLTLCGLATLALPSRSGPLEEWYPMVFSAMIVGLTAACAMCTWAGSAPRQGTFANQSATGTQRYLRAAKRFAFLNAALAVLVAMVMAIWPRLPMIATMDDSLGRVLAGFGVNLGLLWVVLWCGRRQRRPAFQILTLLTLITTGGFLLVRMLPYGSSVG